MRYTTQTITISSVAGSGSGTSNTVITAATSLINLLKIKVTPSIAGGTAELQIYKSDTFASNKLLYVLGPASGIFYDPEQNDAGVISAGLEGFVAPYEDDDATKELHLKILNNDTQTKNYDIEVTYEPVTAYPIIYSQSTEPTIASNSFAIWLDTDDSKQYFISNVGGAQKKVELT